MPEKEEQTSKNDHKGFNIFLALTWFISLLFLIISFFLPNISTNAVLAAGFLFIGTTLYDFGDNLIGAVKNK